MSVISLTQLDVNWLASSDASGILNYDVERNGVVQPPVVGNSVSYSGLAPNTAYNFRVRARDTAQNAGPYTAIVQGTTADLIAPGLPGSVAAVAISSSTINITWTAASDTGGSGIAGYEILKDGVTVLSVGDVLQYSDTGLGGSSTHTYQVRSVDGSSNRGAYSTQVQATTQAASGGNVVTHDGSLVVTGNNFGPKSTPIRLADFGTSADNTLDPSWSNAQPNAASNPYANLKNRSFSPNFINTMSGSTIARPHPFAVRTLAGCHLDFNNGNGGNNVMPWINFNKVNGSYLTGSYYVRNDPNWPDGDAADANYKKLNYGSNGDPYLAPNWYVSGFGGAKSDQTWACNDDVGFGNPAASLLNPDVNGHNNYFWEFGMGDFWANWIRVSFIIKISNANDGFIRVWEGNRLVFDYLGPTDRYAGTSRSLGIEGYNRTRGTVQWRYIVDACMDFSPSPGRWFAANNAVWASATIIEQFPHYDVATGTAQPLRVKQGHFANGSPFALHYRDEALGHQVKTGYSFA